MLTVDDIYNVRSTFLEYETYWSFRCRFSYNFTEILCVYKTLYFRSREIINSFRYSMISLNLIGLMSNESQLTLYEVSRDYQRIVLLLVDKKI